MRAWHEVVIEGGLGVHVKFLIHWVVEEGLISLDELNRKLVEFRYGHGCDAPSPIKDEYLNYENGKLPRQSATQLWLLARVLPFVLLPFLEDESHLRCFAMHLEILSTCSVVTITEQLIGELNSKVQNFIELFVHLFGKAAYIPKIHFYLHFARTMRKYGPLRYLWCMRFEARHRSVKTWALLSNFKNVPFSCVNSYCDEFCLTFLKVPGHSALDVLNTPIIGSVAFSYLPKFDFDVDDEVFEVEWAQVDGMQLKPGSVIRSGDKAESPQYGVLKRVFSCGKQFFLGLQPLETREFDYLLQAWGVTDAEENAVYCKFGNEHRNPGILSLWRYGNSNFVSDRNFSVLNNLGS